VAIDLFASARSTALITLVAASFTAPVVVKGDALDGAREKLTGKSAAAAPAKPPEELVAGGVAFEMPADWGRQGATAAAAEADGAKQVGVVVTALCPGGMSGGACADDSKLTFLAYSGRDGRSLPLLSLLDGQLDEQLGDQYPGFEPGHAQTVTSGDGSIRYLDYSFTWKAEGGRRAQRLAAYRHQDGSGVVVVSSGADSADHDEQVDDFLASASQLVDEA
jgi:hypothetical protein